MYTYTWIGFSKALQTSDIKWQYFSHSTKFEQNDSVYDFMYFLHQNRSENGIDIIKKLRTPLRVTVNR